MTMIRRVVPAQVSQLADDEVEVIISTGDIARDGHILEPGGANLAEYRRNPIVLWQHDPLTPVGRAEDVKVTGDKITARVRFAPDGISTKADEVRGLVKSGIVSTLSVGFDPVEATPLDPSKPRGGQRIHAWELLEFSFCSVPVDPGAVVTARAEEARAPNNDKEKAGMTTNSDDKARALAAARTRMLVTNPGKPEISRGIRGLYEVARLACALEDIGYIHNSSAWEAEVENDDSPVPAMIGEALVALGNALVAMSIEEVKEFLTGRLDDEAIDEVIVVETRDLAEPQRAQILAGKTARQRMWRLAVAQKRAGKSISASNEKRLGEADDHAERAMKHHKSMGDHHGAVGEQMEALRGYRAKADEAHAATGEALKAATDEPEKASEHVARAIKSHAKATGAMEDMANADASMKDRHEDVGDSHRAMARSMKSCQRCMRAVMDGSTPGEGSDSTEIQKSGGTAEDEGSRGHDFRRRQADLLLLSNPDLTTH